LEAWGGGSGICQLGNLERFPHNHTHNRARTDTRANAQPQTHTPPKQPPNSDPRRANEWTGRGPPRSPRRRCRAGPPRRRVPAAPGRGEDHTGTHRGGPTCALGAAVTSSASPSRFRIVSRTPTSGAHEKGGGGDGALTPANRFSKMNFDQMSNRWMFWGCMGRRSKRLRWQEGHRWGDLRRSAGGRGCGRPGRRRSARRRGWPPPAGRGTPAAGPPRRRPRPAPGVWPGGGDSAEGCGEVVGHGERLFPGGN